MAKLQNRSLKFRLRGYQMADGSEWLVFADDAAPVNPDGSIPTLLFDQNVVQSETVTDNLLADAGTIADPSH